MFNFIFSNIPQYGLMPLGSCMGWDPNLLAMVTIGNGLVVIAYIVVAFQLLWTILAYKTSFRTITQYKIARMVYSLLALSGAITYIWQIVIIYFPWYNTLAAICVANGVISLSCAAVLQLITNVHPKDGELIEQI